MQPWIAVPLGIFLIFLAVWDILLTLMTATGRGPLSRQLMRLAWRGMRPLVQHSRPYREIVGPLAFIGVIGLWAILMVNGWALIYWPFLPGEFLVDFGLDLERGSPDNLLAAIYFSMVVLVTLGFGDIVPTAPWLRILVTIQGLVGFGLLTAGISWFLSIHPAITRRRRLAHQISLAREAERDSNVRWDSDAIVELLGSFSSQLIDLHSDQIQFPVIYYFRDADPAGELAPNLRYLLELAGQAQDEFGEAGSSIDLHQHMLRRAVHDYVQTIASQFLDIGEEDIERGLEAISEDRM